MKLATYQTADGPALGIVLAEQGPDRQRGGGLHPLAGLAASRFVQHAGADRKRPRGAGAAASAAAAGRGHRALRDGPRGVRLLAPLPVPPQLRDCSVFAQHVSHAPLGMQRLKAALAGRSAGAVPDAAVPEVYRAQPIWYISNRFSVVGHDAVVRWPAYSRVMDFELEVAIVIGKGGADIPEGEARNHIFGYTIMNDFSARDQQRREMEARPRSHQGQELRHRQRDRPLDRHCRRDRRSLCASGRGARERR